MQKNESKLRVINETLTQKCNYYKDVIDGINQHSKRSPSEDDSKEKCMKCDLLNQGLIEKDIIINSLQSIISNLERDNAKLDQEIQNIEFTFQNFIQESKSTSKQDEEKSKKSKNLFSSTDLIKTFDSKSFEPTASDVDFEYTLEGTTIKSLQGENTPLSSSNEEIQDLEIVN